MLILQTAGHGNSGDFLNSTVFNSTKEQTTTFRNNSYIHCLNRTLQAELRLKSTYAGLTPQNQPSNFTGLYERHHANAQKLVRLVILNRGIPEEAAPFSLGLSRKIGQFCKNMPSAIRQPAAKLTVQQLHSNLLQNYKRLLEEAPYKDIESIKALRDIATYSWDDANVED